MQESVQFTDNGTLKMLSRSRQEYKFTADGMSRTGSAPLSTQGQAPLKVQPLGASSAAGIKFVFMYHDDGSIFSERDEPAAQ